MLAGAQVPRVRSVPAASSNDCQDAVFLARSYGLPPDPWQELVLESWLGLRADGKWAASRCGLAVPRQNGKNAAVEMRELYGTIVRGERFLHTAHEVKTARKAFLRLLSFFENDRKYPELAAKVKEIRKTNGQEAILLHNGGSVEFVARSKGSGRGFSVDVLILDEAQELSDEALEALLPTISVSPNPQTIFTGTPPGPKAIGEVFTRVRNEGNVGLDPRLAWLEWSAVGDIDLDDRRIWAYVNPALGDRLAWETVADERGAFSDEGFARERLGMWAVGAPQAIIPQVSWTGAADIRSQVDGAVAFAVDTDEDGATTSISVAGRRSDGRYHVEVIDNDAGTDWVAARLRSLAAQWSPLLIVANGPAAALVPALGQAIPVLVVNTTELGVASMGLRNAVIAGQVRHIAQPVLNVSLDGARKRPSGEGWIISRRDADSDMTPIISVALALYGFMINAPKRRTKTTKVVVM